VNARSRYTPLIHTYLKRYQDDPSSRVFAPLAEAYRKAGLVDEAIEIAREGIKVHPSFIGGRVALARALFDKKQFDDVIAEVEPIVRDVPDNILAQKLMAESCLMIGRQADALAAYKMLLYFSPQDPETSAIVRELETQAYQKGVLVLEREAAEAGEFTVGAARDAIEADPQRVRGEWVRRIEVLQGLLQKVEQYRHGVDRSN
jgi:predicted Zn-dependent protease